MSTLEKQLGSAQHVIGGPFGSKLTQKDYTAEGVPVIRGSNMVSGGRWIGGEFAFVSEEKVDADLRSNLAQPGDIIVTQRGTLGQVAIVSDRGGFDRYVISQSQMAVRVPQAKADRDFVFYFLQSPQFAAYVENSTIQTGVPHINLGILRNAPAVWPNRHRQTEIASVLAYLDDKIELNRRMNETLEAMARAIFRDWFVDFGPTRAKAEGRAPYLAPEIWDMFPDALDDEDKPIGWEAGTTLDIAELISGGTPKTGEPAFWNGDIPWASAKDVSACREGFLVETERAISELGLKRSSTKIVPKFSTVVIARGATTGRYCMFGGDIAMNQTCYALRQRDNQHFFLHCWFANLVGGLVHAAHGSVFDTITTNTFKNTKALIPPDHLRSMFEVVVAPIYLRILANIVESRTLARTRDLLLPKLMSGEICLSDAGEMIDEVA